MSEKEFRDRLLKLVRLSTDFVELTTETVKGLAEKTRKDAIKQLRNILAGLQKSMDIISEE